MYSTFVTTSIGKRKMEDGSCHHLPYYYWTAATAGKSPLI